MACVGGLQMSWRRNHQMTCVMVVISAANLAAGGDSHWEFEGWLESTGIKTDSYQSGMSTGLSPSLLARLLFLSDTGTSEAVSCVLLNS